MMNQIKVSATSEKEGVFEIRNHYGSYNLAVHERASNYQIPEKNITGPALA